MIKIFTYLICTVVAVNGLCQTANFSFSSTNGSFCAPSTIRFTQTVTGTPTGYVWIFGNNSGSNSGNPTTVYTTAGTYTVRLIVIYKKNTVQVTKTIVINPAVIAQVEYDRNNICAPGTINFHAAVPGNISSYQWNFGDGSGIVTSTVANTSHYFSNYSTYSVSLKAVAATGCSGETSATITVERPAIVATVLPVSGCIPATVHFSSYASLTAPSAVIRYIWNFGDGTPSLTTTTRATTHTYNTAGNYTPKLQIVTNDGCTNDYVFQNLAFGFPPTNLIAYPKKLIFCGSESVGFVSKASNANKYIWDFGEGDSTSVADTITQHKFKTLGTKTVTVTPLYNDCPGNPTSFTVQVIGVIAGYKYSNTCLDKKTFAFNNVSQGNLSTITWSFGEGSPDLHIHDVVHNYPDTGTFETSLYITDSITGCSDTYTVNIYTANPLLLNPDSSICKNSSTTFSIPNNYNNPAALYNWNVIGMQQGPVNTVPLSVQASILGHFNSNYVIIDNGQQYCPDTIKLKNNIIVRGPLLDFNSPAEICRAKTYDVINHSRPFIPTDVITVWNWDYGIPGQTDSVFQPQPYQYPYWGTYQVKLTAIDIKGCMDTLVKSVTVFDIPFLRTIPDVDTLCAGQTSTLIAFHNDPITWSPANSLSCAGCDTVIARPLVSTTYYVKATNRFNCTITDSIPMYVYTPFTATAAKPDNYICANRSVQLAIMPANKKISWSPSTGLSDTTISNPIASPKQRTTYTVTLADSAGCFSSSAQVNVFVKSLPTVDAGPNEHYPYNTNFSFTPLYSNNVRTYLWTPSELLNCSNCAAPTGIATHSQTYTVTVTSDSGCIASGQVNIFIECNGASLLLPTAFTPNHDNLNDYFYPITRGIQKIIRFAIYNREGQLVYEARNFIPSHGSSGWDGTFKGSPQTSAAYVYEVEAICEIGEKIDKKGSFMLIR